MAKSRFFQEHKASVIAGIAVTLTVLAIILAMYRLPSALDKSSSVTEAATSTATKPVAVETTSNPTDEGPYKGWQTYANKAWGPTLLYPPTWTVSETAANTLRVTFLGPPMPGGSPYQNECTYGIFVETVPAAAKLEDYVAAARLAPQGGGDITSQIETTLDSYPAIEIVDTYVDFGQPFKRTRLWMIKNRKAYTFTYAADLNYKAVDYYVMHDAEAYQITASIVIH